MGISNDIIIILNYSHDQSESSVADYTKTLPYLISPDDDVFDARELLKEKITFSPNYLSEESQVVGFIINCYPIEKYDWETITLTNPLSQAEFEQSRSEQETASFRELQEQLQTKVEEYRKLYREKFPEKFERTIPEEELDLSGLNTLNTNNSNNNPKSILRNPNSQSEQQKKNRSKKPDDDKLYRGH